MDDRETVRDRMASSGRTRRRLREWLARERDDERQRIAQVLHDTAAQDLAALKMILTRVVRTAGASLGNADHSALAESIELTDRSLTAVRTLSYLLYPRHLDDIDLVSALRAYARGFEKRSGIAVELDLPPTLDLLNRKVETTLFRCLQEALTNVYFHAGSVRVSIRLHRAGNALTLEVADAGRGMPEELVRQRTAGSAVGVGIASLRDQLEVLGGTLDIESGAHGTIMRARLPISA